MFSLQYRRVVGARVHIFLFGRHLGFGNCVGCQGKREICRESRSEVPHYLHPTPGTDSVLTLPVNHATAIQDGGNEDLFYQAIRSAWQAMLGCTIISLTVSNRVKGPSLAPANLSWKVSTCPWSPPCNLIPQNAKSLLKSISR